MPRASNGDYTLPAGNPVTTLTVISSTWANTTLEDIADAITDSLSRSGDGSMLTELLLADGAAGAPGLSWGTETTSGLYRAGAGDHRYTISGADKLQITTNGIRVADGAVATPSLSFLNDQDTGFYSVSGNIMGVAVGGVQVARLSSTFVDFNVQVALADGTVGSPAISFDNDGDTGLYSAGANILGLVTGGALTLSVSAATTDLNTGAFRVADGLVGTPSLTFFNDPDTGFYRPGANNINISTGGSRALNIDPNGVYFNDGTISLPSISFFNDTNTGFYRATDDRIDLVANGILQAYWGSSDIVHRRLTYFPNGTAAGPSISFESDTDTGIYRITTDAIGISAGGVNRMSINGSGIFGAERFYAPDADLAAPSYSFTNDTDTGMYLPGANLLTLVCGGQEVLFLTTTAVHCSKQLSLTVNSVNAALSGGASALPANPVGYFAITINGTQRRVPYYAD